MKKLCVAAALCLIALCACGSPQEGGSGGGEEPSQPHSQAGEPIADPPEEGLSRPWTGLLERLDLSPLEGRDFVINQVLEHPSIGFVAPSYVDGQGVLLLFDSGGSLHKEVQVENGEQIFQFEPDAYRKLMRVSIAELGRAWLVFDWGGQTSSNVAFFDLEDLEYAVFYPGIHVDGGDLESRHVYEQDGYQVRLYLPASREDWDFFLEREGTVDLADSPTGVVALCHNPAGEQAGYSMVPAQALHGFFGWVHSGSWNWTSGGDESAARGTSASLNLDNLVFRMDCPSAGQGLTANLLTREGWVDYIMTPADISRVYDSSPSGRYQLVLANQGWGGDSTNWGNIALYDTATDTLGFLALSSSSSILVPAQFIDGETILLRPLPEEPALYRLEDLRPYLSPSLELRKENENGDCSPFNTTYDPAEDRFYLAFASQRPGDGGQRDFTGTTYRLAVFDRQGAQLGEMDTGIPCGETAPSGHWPCPDLRVSGGVFYLDGRPVDLTRMSYD